MDAIIFVGEKMAGYFAEEYSKVHDFEYHIYSPQVGSDIRKSTDDILNLARKLDGRKCFIIYDVDIYINEPAVIASEISAVVNTFSAMPIIYMPSYLPESNMTKALLSKDIKHFIFSGSSSDLKEQLGKNIAGYYDANGRYEIDEVIRKQQEAKASVLNLKTVALAGTQHRIGTTTQAVQIVKYLNYLGHTACYVELNNNKYLDANARSGSIRSLSLVEKYALFGEKYDNKVVFSGVDMYTGQAGLSESIRTQYEYMVFDYGSVTEQDFDRTAFAKDDIRIFVGGCKPTEMDSLETMLSIPLYSDANVMISFAPEGEQESILKLISEVRNTVNKNDVRPVMFCPYTPNPFTFTLPEIYSDFFPIAMSSDRQKEMSEKQKKGGIRLFKKQKKG